MLWHSSDRRFLSWGAAGWHICFDVLDRLLAGEPIGRIGGPEAMKFDGWQRSSHRAVAVCNDCHAPHDVVGKYVTKARNGFWHSFYFTTGTFAEPIRITPRNARVTEGACRTCHADIVQAIDTRPKPGEALGCVGCHRNVGHLH